MFSVSGPLPLEALLVFSLLALLCGRVIGKAYGWLPGLTLAYTILSALRIFQVSESPWVGQTDLWKTSFSLSAASTLVALALILLGTHAFRRGTWLTIFQSLAIVNAFWILIEWPFHEPQGMLFNASMSGCLNAAIFPLFWSKKKAPLVSALLIPLSIVACHQSQPLALLFIPIGLYCIRRKEWDSLLIAAAVSLALGYFLCGDALFHSSGRLQVWADIYRFWIGADSKLLGLGLGSFYYLGPLLTVQKYHLGFLWAHNDWLQILFEQGIVGLVLAVATFQRALVLIYRREALFSSLFVFGCFMIANFPLHNPISALFGAVLIRLAFSETSPKV
jgi:O-antigen ligase